MGLASYPTTDHQHKNLTDVGKAAKRTQMGAKHRDFISVNEKLNLKITFSSTLLEKVASCERRSKES